MDLEGETPDTFPAIRLSQLNRDMWTKIRILQVFTSDDLEEDELDRVGGRAIEHHHGGLSPIPEVSNETL